MGLLYGIYLRLRNFLIFFLIVVMMPGLPPRTTFPFKEFEIAPLKELKGALEPNNHLDGAERLLEGRVYGPECLIARRGEIYTGIHGGEVIKLTAQHVTHVTKIGQPCEDIFEEARCGRPLGLAFDTQGNNLIVSDAYYGLWLVDLASGKKKLLVSPQQVLPGQNDVNRPAKIFNYVAVDKRGDIYWTDSSSDFTVQDLIFTLLVNPSGRLFKYDRATNESKLLLDELNFANGVALSPNEDFLVVVETGASRLVKYHLKGAKAGESEVFVDGLPGHPDNLTPDADGLWVPLAMAADSEHPSPVHIFSRFPSIRVFLTRVLALIEMPFRVINNYYPNKVCQQFVHFIGHGESITLLAPKRSTIVRVDWNGNIVGSLHGSDGTVGAISHVLEVNDELLLGSPFNRFLARVKSPKAAQQHNVKIKNVRYEGGLGIEPTQKPVVQPAKPTKITTTTTPKPTTTTTTTTTTPRPTTTTTRTTTTTPKPTTTTTPKPATTTTTTTTPKPAAASSTRAPPKKPAPVEEKIPADTKPPQQEKLKVINKQGAHVEL